MVDEREHRGFVGDLEREQPAAGFANEVRRLSFENQGVGIRQGLRHQRQQPVRLGRGAEELPRLGSRDQDLKRKRCDSATAHIPRSQDLDRGKVRVASEARDVVTSAHQKRQCRRRGLVGEITSDMRLECFQQLLQIGIGNLQLKCMVVGPSGTDRQDGRWRRGQGPKYLPVLHGCRQWEEDAAGNIGQNGLDLVRGGQRHCVRHCVPQGRNKTWAQRAELHLAPLHEGEEIHEKGGEGAGLKGPRRKRREERTEIVRRPIHRLRCEYRTPIDGKEHVFGPGP